MNEDRHTPQTKEKGPRRDSLSAIKGFFSVRRSWREQKADDEDKHPEGDLKPSTENKGALHKMQKLLTPKRRSATPTDPSQSPQEEWDTRSPESQEVECIGQEDLQVQSREDPSPLPWKTQKIPGDDEGNPAKAGSLLEDVGTCLDAGAGATNEEPSSPVPTDGMTTPDCEYLEASELLEQLDGPHPTSCDFSPPMDNMVTDEASGHDLPMVMDEAEAEGSLGELSPAEKVEMTSRRLGGATLPLKVSQQREKVSALLQWAREDGDLPPSSVSEPSLSQSNSAVKDTTPCEPPLVEALLKVSLTDQHPCGDVDTEASCAVRVLPDQHMSVVAATVTKFEGMIEDHGTKADDPDIDTDRHIPVGVHATMEATDSHEETEAHPIPSSPPDGTCAVYAVSLPEPFIPSKGSPPPMGQERLYGSLDNVVISVAEVDSSESDLPSSCEDECTIDPSMQQVFQDDTDPPSILQTDPSPSIAIPGSESRIQAQEDAVQGSEEVIEEDQNCLQTLKGLDVNDRRSEESVVVVENGALCTMGAEALATYHAVLPTEGCNLRHQAISDEEGGDVMRGDQHKAPDVEASLSCPSSPGPAALADAQIMPLTEVLTPCPDDKDGGPSATLQTALSSDHTAQQISDTDSEISRGKENDGDVGSETLTDKPHDADWSSQILEGPKTHHPESTMDCSSLDSPLCTAATRAAGPTGDDGGEAMCMNDTKLPDGQEYPGSISKDADSSEEVSLGPNRTLDVQHTSPQTSSSVLLEFPTTTQDQTNTPSAARHQTPVGIACMPRHAGAACEAMELKSPSLLYMEVRKEVNDTQNVMMEAEALQAKIAAMLSQMDAPEDVLMDDVQEWCTEFGTSQLEVGTPRFLPEGDGDEAEHMRDPNISTVQDHDSLCIQDDVDKAAGLEMEKWSTQDSLGHLDEMFTGAGEGKPDMSASLTTEGIQPPPTNIMEAKEAANCSDAGCAEPPCHFQEAPPTIDPQQQHANNVFSFDDGDDSCMMQLDEPTSSGQEGTSAQQLGPLPLTGIKAQPARNVSTFQHEIPGPAAAGPSTSLPAMEQASGVPIVDLEKGSREASPIDMAVGRLEVTGSEGLRTDSLAEPTQPVSDSVCAPVDSPNLSVTHSPGLSLCSSPDDMFLDTGGLLDMDMSPMPAGAPGLGADQWMMNFGIVEELQQLSGEVDMARPTQALPQSGADQHGATFGFQAPSTSVCSETTPSPVGRLRGKGTSHISSLIRESIPLFVHSPSPSYKVDGRLDDEKLEDISLYNHMKTYINTQGDDLHEGGLSPVQESPADGEEASKSQLIPPAFEAPQESRKHTKAADLIEPQKLSFKTSPSIGHTTHPPKPGRQLNDRGDACATGPEIAPQKDHLKKVSPAVNSGRKPTSARQGGTFSSSRTGHGTPRGHPNSRTPRGSGKATSHFPGTLMTQAARDWQATAMPQDPVTVTPVPQAQQKSGHAVCSMLPSPSLLEPTSASPSMVYTTGRPKHHQEDGSRAPLPHITPANLHFSFATPEGSSGAMKKVVEGQVTPDTGISPAPVYPTDLSGSPYAKLMALPLDIAINAPLVDSSPFPLDELDTCSLADEAEKMLAAMGQATSQDVARQGRETTPALQEGPTTSFPMYMSPAQESMLQLQCEMLVQKLSEAEARVQAAERQSEELRDQVQILQFEKESYQSADVFEKEARLFAEGELQELRSRFNGAEMELRKQQQMYQALSDKFLQLNEQHEGLQKQIEQREQHYQHQMNQVLAERDGHLERARAAEVNLKSSQSANASLQAAVLKEQQHVVLVEQKCQEQAQNLAEVEKISSENLAKLQKAMEQLISAQTDKERLKKQVEKDQALLRSHQQSAQGLTKLQQERDHFHHKYQHYKKEATLKHQEVHELQRKLEQQKAENQELMNMCEQLLQQIEEQKR